MLEKFWFAPVSTLRSLLLVKGVLFILGFDCLFNMAEYGARYGAGGFNVAHFSIVDALLPMPTPEAYEAAIFITVVGCFVQVVAGYHRALMALVFLAYTYAWAISMLDSYQHHYLLSLLAAAFVFLRNEELDDKSGSLFVPNPAFVFAAFTCATVYAWTAYTKSEPAWLRGEALANMSGLDGVLPDLRNALVSRGIREANFWSTIAATVMASQLVIAIGFFAAPMAAKIRAPDRRWFLIPWIAALGFHLGAEQIGLEIAWFSYYMIWIATIFLLPVPAAWEERVAQILTRFRHRLREEREKQRNAHERSAASRFGGNNLFLVAGMAALVAVCFRADLPGAVLGAMFVCAAIAVIQARVAERKRMGAALICTALVIFAVVENTDVRARYYLLKGGASRRLGDLETAVAAYRKAKQYTEPGNWTPRQQSRLEQLEALSSRPHDD